LTAASALRAAGHEPVLIDARAVRTRLPDLVEAVRRADLTVLQSTPLDRWQCPDLNWRALVRLVRWLRVKPLALAGAHGTLEPELMLRMTEAAALIRGEPETALTALASAGGDPRGLKGLSYLESGRIVHEPRDLGTPLDDLPPPAYDLIHPDHYAYEVLGPRLAVLETSRGCPYSCSFCLKAMYGPGVRYKSLERVLDEVESVVGAWGAKNIYFMDLEFTLDRERTMALCRGLRDSALDFRWCCQTRVDTVDPELLQSMKRSGCALIHFGIETASERLLRTTRKNVTPDQMRRAMAWCREIGLATACFFLFGLPGETPADRRSATLLARDLNPDFVSFHVAAPYPETDLGRLAASVNPFPACLAGEHDLRTLARAVRRAYLSFYLRPAYIRSRMMETGWRGQLDRLGLLWEFLR